MTQVSCLCDVSYLFIVVAKCVCQVDDVLETREGLQQFRRRESATAYTLGIIMCAVECDLSIARKPPRIVRIVKGISAMSSHSRGQEENGGRPGRLETRTRRDPFRKGRDLYDWMIY